LVGYVITNEIFIRTSIIHNY